MCKSKLFLIFHQLLIIAYYFPIVHISAFKLVGCGIYGVDDSWLVKEVRMEGEGQCGQGCNTAPVGVQAVQKGQVLDYIVSVKREAQKVGFPFYIEYDIRI